MEQSLKQALKTVKSNEAGLSLLAGVLVVMILITGGVFLAKEYQKPAGEITETATSTARLDQEETDVSVVTEHMVVQGDNLWRLAEKYYSNGFKFIEIAKANGINQPDQIDIGQKLVIPTVTAASQLLRISDKPITYTVVKGDNLWRIAFRFYGDGRVFGQIVRVNAELIRQPDLIEPGWQLTLPPLEPIS